MKDADRAYLRRARTAKLGAWLAARGSRDTGRFDRLCRRILGRLTRVDPEKDFMRDDWVASHPGFDPDELDRYQRGELD